MPDGQGEITRIWSVSLFPTSAMICGHDSQHCKLKFLLSGMLGIYDWLFLLGPNPLTAWLKSSQNQQNGIWDRLLDSPDMSAKSRMIRKQYNLFSQCKKPVLMEVAQHYRDFVWKNIMRTRCDYCLTSYILHLQQVGCTCLITYHTWLIMSWGIFSSPKCFCANNKENK